MSDPNEFPAADAGLPQENPPQQPQYGYQQPQQPQQGYQQPQQPQYGYRQPQQPQYGYQQPQQPQYGYQQPQQPQYGYQQPQQPQYGYQQPQQPQYGYQQPQQSQYGYQQPQQPQYGYRQTQAAPTVTHTKAIGSMVMMIIALTLLAYPLYSYLANNFRSAFGYGSSQSWLALIAHLSLTAGLILMLVGAIIGSRGHALFGVGLLLCVGCLLYVRLYTPIVNTGSYAAFGFDGLGELLFLIGLFLVTGAVLAAVGCLARVKALKIVGGILMLVNFPLVWFLSLIPMLNRLGVRGVQLQTILYFLGMLFVCIAVLAFPIRRVRKQ